VTNLEITLRAALLALVSDTHAGLYECESDYFCAYCHADPDMSPDVVASRHTADCPIRLGRRALLQPPTTTPADATQQAERAIRVVRQVQQLGEEDQL